MANVTIFSRPGVGVIGNTADVIVASDITGSGGSVRISAGVPGGSVDIPSGDGTRITIDDDCQVMVPSTMSWTASDGTSVTLDSTHSDVEKLKTAFEKLEQEQKHFRKRVEETDKVLKDFKEIASNNFIKAELRGMGLKPTDDHDVNYFLHNMHKALSVPKEFLNPGSELNKLKVGTNDILVIHLNVADVPANRVEAYIKRAKDSVAPLFEDRGLTGRTLWVATRDRETGFSVIGIERPRVVFKNSSIAGALNELAPAKKKPRPPVMG